MATPNGHPVPPSIRRRERGQVLVIFAIALVAMCAMIGLLLDGSMAFVNRRQGQSAADTAALAGAQSASNGSTFEEARASARSIALANGYETDLTACDGTVTPGAGVVVNQPPLSGNFVGDKNFIEVITTRAMHTSFAGVVGMPCWLVTARAVALVAAKGAAPCNFCSLNDTNSGHTLLLNNSSALRVDGDIVVNSTNGGTSGGCTPTKYKVCGDGFDIFGDPPSGVAAQISARAISTTGGWETHDGNIAIADAKKPADCLSLDPPLVPGIASNVCIHMPPTEDPLINYGTPVVTDFTTPTASSCSPINGAPVQGSNGSGKTTVNSIVTLCPGNYSGGLVIEGTASGNAIAYLQPGAYFTGGGGLLVDKGGSIDGSRGVMIYSSGSITISQVPTGMDTDPYNWPASVSDGTIVTVTSSASSVKIGANGATVTYTATVNAIEGDYPGIVRFFDGAPSGGDPWNSPSLCADQTISGPSQTVTCQVTYTDPAKDVGTHGISAVYMMADGTRYVAKALFPRQLVVADGRTGGWTLLSPMLYGPWAGVTMFEARTSSSDIMLSPLSPLANCPANFMTIGVPGGQAPDPCGSLGGIEGTIYGPNDGTTVTITAGGLADLQVISGKILINSSTKARFAYTPSKFANGTIRLVE